MTARPSPAAPEGAPADAAPPSSPSSSPSSEAAGPPEAGVEATPATEAPATGDDGGTPTESAARLMGLRWWHEVLYIVLVYIAYSAVRNQFGSGAGDSVDARPAFHHAEAIIQLERNIGLYFEQAVQQWYLDLPGNGLIRVWNVYYGIFHFIIPAIALVWLYRAAPERYRVWRNTLAATTLVAVVGFATFSLMPPRLMDDPGIYGGCRVYAGGVALPDEAGEAPCDEFGYVDTVAEYGGWASFGSDEMAAVSNQYAAMPSMHIGWSTWCALVLASLAKRRWVQVLAIAYPFVTLFDIIVTGNHYWIDGIGGLVCLGVGFTVSLYATRWFEARFGPARHRQEAAAPAPAG